MSEDVPPYIVEGQQVESSAARLTAIRHRHAEASRADLTVLAPVALIEFARQAHADRAELLAQIDAPPGPGT